MRAFDEFWQTYPKKVGKIAALREWNRLKPDEALVAKIQETLAWQIESTQWRRGYVPNPATWLHQGRWEDEPSVEPERPFTAAEVAEAKRVRQSWQQCQHEPVCETYKQCLARLIRGWRNSPF